MDNSMVGALAMGVGLAVLGMSGSKAAAFINVELRPAFQSVPVGATVSIGLYAVSGSASNQGFAAAQIIFNWQTPFLQMLANSNAGAISLLSSSFPTDPYGLNEAAIPQDGSAMYVANAMFGSPALATPAGTLLTTLRFTALAPTGLTPLNLLASAGNPVGQTIMFDGTIPNTSVTGTLTGGAVQIVPAPASAFIALAGLAAMGRRRRYA